MGTGRTRHGAGAEAPGASPPSRPHCVAGSRGGAASASRGLGAMPGISIRCLRRARAVPGRVRGPARPAALDLSIAGRPAGPCGAGVPRLRRSLWRIAPRLSPPASPRSLPWIEQIAGGRIARRRTRRAGTKEAALLYLPCSRTAEWRQAIPLRSVLARGFHDKPEPRDAQWGPQRLKARPSHAAPRWPRLADLACRSARKPGRLLQLPGADGRAPIRRAGSPTITLLLA